jgi:hypothetical protein
MIDLPDYGYVQRTIQMIDAGGSVPGSLGGSPDYIDRPGLRYSVTYQLREIPTAYDARRFEALLEQGLHQDVSYPWPLDFAPGPSSPGATLPQIRVNTPAGGLVKLKNILPGYQFVLGQPLAIVSGDGGYITKAAQTTTVGGGGTVDLPVFPWTRADFVTDDLVEIQKPRIRGILSWDGSDQGAYSRRGFRFSISER